MTSLYARVFLSFWAVMIAIVAGAMEGAARLAAVAALRSGAGYVAIYGGSGTAGPDALVHRPYDRAALAGRLGCGFALPRAAPPDRDVVIHASATAAGLATALEIAGPEAAVVEASWYGDRPVSIGLGGAFHSRRLRLVASQVGEVPVGRGRRWTRRRRLGTALALLADPATEALLSGETAFADLPARYGGILADPDTLCHLVRYD